jgi:hypothetical protein
MILPNTKDINNENHQVKLDMLERYELLKKKNLIMKEKENNMEANKTTEEDDMNKAI